MGLEYSESPLQAAAGDRPFHPVLIWGLFSLEAAEGKPWGESTTIAETYTKTMQLFASNTSYSFTSFTWPPLSCYNPTSDTWDGRSLTQSYCCQQCCWTSTWSYWSWYVLCSFSNIREKRMDAEQTLKTKNKIHKPPGYKETVNFKQILKFMKLIFLSEEVILSATDLLFQLFLKVNRKAVI